MYLTPAKETWVGKNADEKANLLTHKSVKNIGIIKHGALGDMVHTRPMIISLKEEFPKAKITLGVIEHYMQGIPEDLIDETKKYIGVHHPCHYLNMPPHNELPGAFDVTMLSYI